MLYANGEEGCQAGHSWRTGRGEVPDNRKLYAECLGSPAERKLYHTAGSYAEASAYYDTIVKALKREPASWLISDRFMIDI